MKYFPVVVLHGWNLSASSYSDLFSFLNNAGFKVLIPDLPGFGSKKYLNKPYDTDDYVGFLESYLKKNKINQCIIIGHSFGGRIGIKFSVKHPVTVKKLILTGVPGLPSSSKIKIIIFRILAKVGKTIFALTFLNNLSFFFF